MKPRTEPEWAATTARKPLEHVRREATGRDRALVPLWWQSDFAICEALMLVADVARLPKGTKGGPFRILRRILPRPVTALDAGMLRITPQARLSYLVLNIVDHCNLRC